MKFLSPVVCCGLLLCCASLAQAQLMFDTVIDKVDHPKSHWDRWSSTQVGDFIEYSDGMNLVGRFEAMKVGERQITIRTTTMNPLTKKPIEVTIVHTFNAADRPFGKPTNIVDDKLKLSDREFDTKKEEYLFPDGKQKIKEVWYSEATPFDGMLKYQQYTLGKPGEPRFVTGFKKGKTLFGK